MPYTVTVRDHMMVAHSLRGAVFGPAQALHGATYVIDATFGAPELDADGLVIDIGLASRTLAGVAAVLNYRNLDEVAEFEGLVTSTEFLCRWVADALAARIPAGAVTSIEVTLRETPSAWASYSRAVGAGVAP